LERGDLGIHMSYNGLEAHLASRGAIQDTRQIDAEHNWKKRERKKEGETALQMMTGKPDGFLRFSCACNRRVLPFSWTCVVEIREEI
jgi:hypothetical protein